MFSRVEERLSFVWDVCEEFAQQLMTHVSYEKVCTQTRIHALHAITKFIVATRMYLYRTLPRLRPLSLLSESSCII